MIQKKIRIIPKQEIYTEAKSSLAGTCAIRMYVDGNITFSNQAAELMDLKSNKFFLIAEDENENFYIIPNNSSGYSFTKRKDKYTYLCNSKPIIKYMSTRLKIQIQKRKPLELLLKDSDFKHEDYKCFQMYLQKQNL